MSTQQVKIQRNPYATPTQPGEFSPQAAVANVGDNITWFNGDTTDHWPAPSASNKTGWIKYQIPAGSESRGDLALAPNSVSVSAAINADPVVFTTIGPAPASGVSVTLDYEAPKSGATPWKAVAANPFVATNLSATTFSIPLNTSAFGAYSPATSGEITVSIPGPYTLKYVCALHPAEIGTITVNPQL